MKMDAGLRLKEGKNIKKQRRMSRTDRREDHQQTWGEIRNVTVESREEIQQ